MTITKAALPLIAWTSLAGCGPSVSAEDVCDTLAECGLESDSCIEVFDRQQSGYEDLGCGDESQASLACGNDVLREQLDGGEECDYLAISASCQAEYRSLAECVSANGGGTFACDASDDPFQRSCTSYTNATVTAETVCGDSTEVVDECPDGAWARCEFSGGAADVEILYYEPLPEGLGPDFYEMVCSMNGGTWFPLG